MMISVCVFCVFIECSCVTFSLSETRPPPRELISAERMFEPSPFTRAQNNGNRLGPVTGQGHVGAIIAD